jgi:hypothetical protein
LSHSTSPFCEGYFWDRVLGTVCPGWLWTMILLISASLVARITGMSLCFDPAFSHLQLLWLSSYQSMVFSRTLFHGMLLESCLIVTFYNTLFHPPW